MTYIRPQERFLFFFFRHRSRASGIRASRAARLTGRRPPVAMRVTDTREVFISEVRDRRGCSVATSLTTASTGTVLLPSQMSQIAGHERGDVRRFATWCKPVLNSVRSKPDRMFVGTDQGYSAALCEWPRQDSPTQRSPPYGV